MNGQISRTKSLVVWGLYLLAGGSSSLFAQSSAKEDPSGSPQSQVTSDVLKKVDQLVQQNEQLEKQNHELVAEIKSLRQILAKQDGEVATRSAGGVAPGTDAKSSTEHAPN